jgi:hypothetical protein
LLEATRVCSAKMREATLRICNLANLLRIAWNPRAGPQEYGVARSNKIWNPRPIPQYSIVYESPPTYIKKKDLSNKDYFSINIIRWYNLLEARPHLARDLAYIWPRCPHQYYLCATSSIITIIIITFYMKIYYHDHTFLLTQNF